MSLNQTKENTVTILGSSKNTDSISKYLDICSEVSKSIVLSGQNVLTGCGSGGIMGRAYYSAAQNSTLDKVGKPNQNLAILVNPLWGDEDLENCQVLDTVNSEAERIQKFIETSDKFVIFPGGPATIQEASTLISSNHYSKNKKQVILVGKDYFKGLDEQYKKLKDAGLIKCEVSELYTIVDSTNEILDKIN